MDDVEHRDEIPFRRRRQKPRRAKEATPVLLRRPPPLRLRQPRPPHLDRWERPRRTTSMRRRSSSTTTRKKTRRSMAPSPRPPEKSPRRATWGSTVPGSETSCSSQSCFAQSRTAVLSILPKCNMSASPKQFLEWMSSVKQNLGWGRLLFFSFHLFSKLTPSPVK